MIVNGKITEFEEGMTVSILLGKLALNPLGVVVEVNLDIIPNKQYGDKYLGAEDTIEVISFVGGG